MIYSGVENQITTKERVAIAVFKKYEGSVQGSDDVLLWILVVKLWVEDQKLNIVSIYPSEDNKITQESKSYSEILLKSDVLLEDQH